MEDKTLFEKEVKEENVVDITYGLTCKMTYAEFCVMKETNPNWKGDKK